jgi:hypothetical protein
MKILSTLFTTTALYELELDGKKYIYKEYLDDRGKLIDNELFDDDDNQIFDDGLIQHIEERIYL